VRLFSNRLFFWTACDPHFSPQLTSFARIDRNKVEGTSEQAGRELCVTIRERDGRLPPWDQRYRVGARQLGLPLLGLLSLELRTAHCRSVGALLFDIIFSGGLRCAAMYRHRFAAEGWRAKVTLGEPPMQNQSFLVPMISPEDVRRIRIEGFSHPIAIKKIFAIRLNFPEKGAPYL
jgi:hypothetical protein